MSKSNLIAILFFSSFALQAREYVVPPTSSAGSAGVISDEAMEQCVILYNEANWLSEELDVTPVDNYSQASINSYNSKVQLFNDMQTVSMLIVRANSLDRPMRPLES